MRWSDILKIAWHSLWSSKLRTSLTVLGVAVGITSIMIVFAAGESFNRLIIGQIENFGGSDVFETEIKVPSAKSGTQSEQQNATSMAQGVQITTLTLADFADLLALPNVTDGYAGLLGQEQANYQNENFRALIFGLTSTYPNMNDIEMSAGRFFSEAEDQSLAQVVVLGSKVKEKLFGDSDPLGRAVQIKKKKFKVLGVAPERGSMMFFDFDDLIYMPIRTLQKKVMNVNHVQMMMHRVADVSRINDTAEDARYQLRLNHGLPLPSASAQNWMDTGKDDFRVVTMQETMAIMSTVTSAVTILLLAIVAISLVVGGIGIINIMYVIVTERTGEIGLRKAVGACYADIMKQFLAEATMTTFFGGLFGMLLGTGIARLIAWQAVAYGLDWEFAVPARAFAVAAIFSVLCGIVFGLFPARKAARLEPIAAIRRE